MTDKGKGNNYTMETENENRNKNTNDIDYLENVQDLPASKLGTKE